MFEFVGKLFDLVGIIFVHVVPSAEGRANKRKKLQSFDGYLPLVQDKFHTDIKEFIRLAKVLNPSKISEGRRRLASDFLVNKFECWQKAAIEFSEKIDECSTDCDLSCFECTKIYEMAMQMFEDGVLYERLGFDNIPLEDRESLDVFTIKFREWNEERLETFKRKIYDICHVHENYRTCHQKGARILEALADMIDDAYKDATHTIQELNGQLNGKKWKGYTL